MPFRARPAGPHGSLRPQTSRTRSSRRSLKSSTTTTCSRTTLTRMASGRPMTRPCGPGTHLRACTCDCPDHDELSETSSSLQATPSGAPFPYPHLPQPPPLIASQTLRFHRSPPRLRGGVIVILDRRGAPLHGCRSPPSPVAVNSGERAEHERARHETPTEIGNPRRGVAALVCIEPEYPPPPTIPALRITPSPWSRSLASPRHPPLGPPPFAARRFRRLSQRDDRGAILVPVRADRQ